MGKDIQSQFGSSAPNTDETAGNSQTPHHIDRRAKIGISPDDHRGYLIITPDDYNHDDQFFVIMLEPETTIYDVMDEIERRLKETGIEDKEFYTEIGLAAPLPSGKYRSLGYTATISQTLSAAEGMIEDDFPRFTDAANQILDQNSATLEI